MPPRKAAADWVSEPAYREKGDMLTSSDNREICCACECWLPTRCDDGLFSSTTLPGGDWSWRSFLRLVQTAHVPARRLVPYHAVFNGRMPVNSLSWYSLSRCMTILKRALKQPNLIMAAALNREGSHAAFIWRQMLGEWQGWWAVRKDYVQIFETVRNLQGRVITIQPLRKIILW